ncbi:hypothetical protein L0P88_13585 [Muricauda sp. SCSIO 64092]|uniref:hypothetical protein n=1 Tax=Allomuricauda sp. SCSIO 64092 TaxID=2908842 RepID=UPI001FF44CD3|nr:hypothetical protein [Muricauda sp. SCSIO 64092]UOY04983.1 hypothetical protein L0P88_13585 [Muricauda sp. SCSIO 64092]
MSKIDPTYVKGFNHGYLFAEHLSALAQKMLKCENKAQYFTGFENGVDAFRQHQKVQSRSEELNSIRDHKHNERDQER